MKFNNNGNLVIFISIEVKLMTISPNAINTIYDKRVSHLNWGPFIIQIESQNLVKLILHDQID